MGNREIAMRRETTIARGVAVHTQVYVNRAENAEIWDVEERRYIVSLRALQWSIRDIGTRRSSRQSRLSLTASRILASTWYHTNILSRWQNA